MLSLIPDQPLPQGGDKVGIKVRAAHVTIVHHEHEFPQYIEVSLRFKVIFLRGELGMKICDNQRGFSFQ